MGNSENIGLILILAFVMLAILPTDAMSSTVIGDSEVSVEEGEIYTWCITYVRADLEWLYQKNTEIKLIVEKIYIGPYDGVSSALIVNATEVGPSSRRSYPTYIVYNKSLNYICFEPNYLPDIVPIPLNLTLVAAYYETQGKNCSIQNNTLISSTELDRWEYTYDSNGIATLIEWKGGDQLGVRMELGECIPFGSLGLVFSTIAIISIIISINKRVLLKKSKFYSNFFNHKMK